MTETIQEIQVQTQGNPTVYDTWTEDELAAQVEKMHEIDDSIAHDIRETINNMLRESLGVNSHHEHIRSLNNPAATRIAFQEQYEDYREKLKAEQFNSHLAAEGIEVSYDAFQHEEPDDFDDEDLIIDQYVGQIAGEAFFDINGQLSSLADFRDMQWWVIEENTAWQEETRNPAGEHLARTSPDQPRAYYIELDGEPVTPDQLEGLHETLQLREDLRTDFSTDLANQFLAQDSLELIETTYRGDDFEQDLAEARELGLITDDNDLTLFGYLSQFDMDTEAIERNNFVQAARDGPQRLHEYGFLRVTDAHIRDIDVGEAYTDSYQQSITISDRASDAFIDEFNTDYETSYLDDDDDDDLLGSYISDGGLSMDPEERATTISNRDLETTLGLGDDQIAAMIQDAIEQIEQISETDYTVRTDDTTPLTLTTLVPDGTEPRRPEAPDPPDGMFGTNTLQNYTTNLDDDFGYEEDSLYDSILESGYQQDTGEPVEPDTGTTRRQGDRLVARTEIMIDRGVAELYTIEDELEDQGIDLPSLDDNSSFTYDIDMEELSDDAQAHLTALDHLDYLVYDIEDGTIHGNRSDNHTKYLLPVEIELGIDRLEMPQTEHLETTLGYERTDDGFEPSYAMEQLEQAWDPRQTPDEGYRDVTLETSIGTRG